MKPISEMNLAECLEALRDSSEFYTNPNYAYPSYVKTLADRIHDLTRWMPVSERMPTHEDGGEWRRVLIRYNDGDIDSIFVGNVSQFTTGSEFWITHWQRITPPETP
jgi:hypothetical protein